jgi:phosphocarrier protein
VSADASAPSGVSADTAVHRARVTLVNKRGLHARASAKFVTMAAGFDAEVTVHHDGQSVSGGSIMGLMMFAAGPGDAIEIAAEGPEGAHAVAALAALVADGFGERD